MPEQGKLKVPEVEGLRVRVKRELRKKLRAVRTSLPRTVREQKSRELVAQMAAHPWFAEARGVALFWPNLERGEVDLRGLEQHCRAADKRVYYPFMEPNAGGGYSTGFRELPSGVDLVDYGRGFLEPEPSLVRAERGVIDLIIVPALAVSPDGHRIGYGLGFYDITLPEFCPPARSCVAVFSFQLILETPAEEHDFKCDAVVSEKEFLCV